MKDKTIWSFCETPEEKCTMNYCDENGCQNRKRNYVEGNNLTPETTYIHKETNPDRVYLSTESPQLKKWCKEQMKKST
jgi:hypothetical protein